MRLDIENMSYEVSYELLVSFAPLPLTLVSCLFKYVPDFMEVYKIISEHI